MPAVRFPLGVVDVVFGPRPLAEAAVEAKRLGFAHIDVSVEVDDEYAVPIGDRMSFPSPRPDRSCPAPPESEGAWERAVAAYRRSPGMRLEPWGGSIVNSVAKVRAMIDEVPGLRLLVDTGHVASWGEDPVELLPWADHVQLRQASSGVVQAPAPDQGDVDFTAVIGALDALDYPGLLSIEYFDLPEYGWPLADPLGHALALREMLLPLLERED
ncbi:MAG: xylose isomerase-like protein [Acidimicrobiales bacterium]|jgi:sugar phosphate isomerase/epimerase|nr:xylose isomerase-like protein [Acidimicrobiales bacterium]